MSYQKVLRYLNSFANYEKNLNYSYKKALRIQRIEDFLSLIGDPQESLRVIHIAGTKGKGSTCAFVAYILREAGFSAGLYTSPHLNDFRERIRVIHNRRGGLNLPYAVDNSLDFEGMISQKDLTNLVEELKPLITKYNRHCQYGPLTFFEVYTAIAFLYFKRKKVDFAVLETGLGGRLDATNAAPSLVQVITPISYEHTQKLGKTLAEIATEKAGIIKPVSKCQSVKVSKRMPTVITAPQKREVLRVIRNKCQEAGVKWRIANNIIKSPRLKINLIGGHQLINASCAIKAVEGLGDYGFKISKNAICRGLKNTRWPGRCEIIARNPLIVLDGAQNVASAEVLKKAVKDNFQYQKLILVLGISDDKDIAGICRVLDPLADEVIITCAKSLRAANPKKISAYFKRKVYLTQGVKEAKILAAKLAGRKDLILVTGSLFVVGEFRSV